MIKDNYGRKMFVGVKYYAGSRESFELLMYSTEKRIAFKGAISKGNLTADSGKQLYFGQPLIDAYLLSEEILMYGVIIHHTVEKDIDSHSVLFVNKKVPLRTGQSYHYIINWFENKGRAQNALNIIREDVSGSPRRYIDNTLWLMGDE